MPNGPTRWESLGFDLNERTCIFFEQRNSPKYFETVPWKQPSGANWSSKNLSSVLERWIQRNEKHRRSTKRETITMFHGTRAPDMSVRQYMERIYKYASCSPCCFVIAQIYMDRYFERKGGYLTSFNVHRLLITTVMVAAKFVDDGCYSNGHYARVGGVCKGEMNRMELELLFSLDFRLFVPIELFSGYCERLHQTRHIANK